MRLAVLVSGSGTLFESIVAAGLPVALVVADRPCRGLDLASEGGLNGVLLERTKWDDTFDRESYALELAGLIANHDIDLVAMAGFGTVLDEPVFEAMPGQILNSHPALLPAFPGWHAVRDAIEFGVKVTGCTIHVATPEVDQGPILAQEAVPVLDEDDESSLHERIKTAERRLYVETLQTIAESGQLLGYSIYDHKRR